MCSNYKLAVLVSSLVSLSEGSIDPTPTTQQETQSGSEDTEPVNASMQEFYQLYQKLLVITLVLTGDYFYVCVDFLFLKHRPKLFYWGLYRCGLLKNAG